mmetsp:Transcript_32724/g.98859  ORF Transcript_32724/g.98859 Transcript_32724/m.98859 type:complete len:383 (+) Transcript_32724:74-1222(+)
MKICAQPLLPTAGRRRHRVVHHKRESTNKIGVRWCPLVGGTTTTNTVGALHGRPVLVDAVDHPLVFRVLVVGPAPHAAPRGMQVHVVHAVPQRRSAQLHRSGDSNWRDRELGDTTHSAMSTPRVRLQLGKRPGVRACPPKVDAHHLLAAPTGSVGRVVQHKGQARSKCPLSGDPRAPRPASAIRVCVAHKRHPHLRHTIHHATVAGVLVVTPSVVHRARRCMQVPIEALARHRASALHDNRALHPGTHHRESPRAPHAAVSGSGVRRQLRDTTAVHLGLFQVGTHHLGPASARSTRRVMHHHREPHGNRRGARRPTVRRRATTRRPVYTLHSGPVFVVAVHSTTHIVHVVRPAIFGAWPVVQMCGECVVSKYMRRIVCECCR